MKLRVTFLFVSLLFAATSDAQLQTPTGIPFRAKSISILSADWKARHHAPAHENTGAQKGTNTVARLSANYDGVGTNSGAIVNQDSSTYRYTSNAHLGFDLTGNVPQVTAGGMILIGDYDTGVNYTWNVTTNNYIPGFRIINIFDAQNREVRQFFQAWQSNSWKDFNRYSHYYNAAGNDTLGLSESWNSVTSAWDLSDRTLFTYNAAGDVIKEVYQNYDLPTTTWKNSDLDSFAYDTNHDETYQLQQKWSIFHNAWYNYAQAVFTYTAAFNEQDVMSQNYDTLASVWKNYYHMHAYYNTSDQVIATTTQNGSGTSWINSDSSSYPLLDAAGRPLSTLSFNWTSGAWHPTNRTTVSGGGTGLPFIGLFEQWNGTAFVNAFRTTSFYNTYGKPTNIFTEHWNGSAFVVNASDNVKRYYYDLVSTAVGNVATPGVEAYLYPIPASSLLNLAVHLLHPEACTGMIYDVLGRQVLQWNETPQTFYTRNIPVSSLPAGQYYLRLQGNTVHWTHAFEVVH